MAKVKKYHQTRKDREDERKGMERYERRREEKGSMDSRYFHMLSEDHSAPANLPQHVVHEEYPKCEYLDRFEIDDTIRGLDDTRDEDVRKLDEYASDSKW